MRDRWYGKGSKKYDPQVGEAAKQNAAVAQQAQDWNKDFYETYVAPALLQSMKESEVNLGRQGEIFDLQMSQAKLADERYRTLGIPAEDRYYRMVDEYNAPERAEQDAQSAIGDIRVAAQGQAAAENRRLRGLGIDPTSPAAMAARSDMNLQQAAVEAKAATDARRGAKLIGMQLASDAANFGRGGQSGVLSFGQAASGASSAGLGGSQNQVGVASGGAANVNAGLGLAQKAYGANLDAYTSLQKQAMQSSGGLAAGLGQLGGALLSNPSLFSSDRRLKTSVSRIAILAHDIGVWTFRYIWEPVTAPLRVGYMADEVEPAFPDAVAVGPGGFKMVDYSKVYV